MKGGTNERMNDRTDKRKSPCVPPVFYRTLYPLGPLPKKDEIDVIDVIDVIDIIHGWGDWWLGMVKRLNG